MDLHLVGAYLVRMTLPSQRGGFFSIDLDRFQGPLDLLLHLIRQQDIDIFDIPIARVTHQFLGVIQGIDPEGLDRAGEFLEMAATLVRIKARMLLPRGEEGEEEDPRAELVRRLLEYEQIREVIVRLASAEARRARLFGRAEPRSLPRTEAQPLESSWEELLEAALGIRTPEPAGPEHAVPHRTIAMEEKIELIVARLEELERVEFSQLTASWREPIHAVMTFLAGLELSRRRVVILRQVRPFSELWIYRQEGSRAAAGR